MASNDDAVIRLEYRAEKRDRKTKPKMKVSGRGMKRFATPPKRKKD